MTGDGNDAVWEKKNKNKQLPLNWAYLNKQITLCLHDLLLLVRQPKDVCFLEPDAYMQ